MDALGQFSHKEHSLRKLLGGFERQYSLGQLDSSLEVACDLEELIRQSENTEEHHLFSSLRPTKTESLVAEDSSMVVADDTQITLTVNEDLMRTLQANNEWENQADDENTCFYSSLATDVEVCPDSAQFENTSSVSSRTSTGGRERSVEKQSDKYRSRRERNNIAVRKSRGKAKLKQRETEEKVRELTAENERLQNKMDLLSKELSVLRSLFVNVGGKLPPAFEEFKF